MYKLATTLCLILAANFAFAQEEDSTELKKFLTVQNCVPVSELTISAMFEYGEQPLFYGLGMQVSAQANVAVYSEMMFFVNQDTGTWSLLSRYTDGTGCIVAVGEDFTPYSGPSTLVQRD